MEDQSTSIINKVHVKLQISVVSRDDFYSIDMGEVEETEITGIENIIRNSYDTVQFNRSLYLKDISGESYIFNVENIICIKLKIEPVVIT